MFLEKFHHPNFPLDLTKAQILQLWTKLHEAHTQTCTSVFQTVVLTGLVPLFTLLAGYVFGKSHSGENQTK